MLRLFATCVLRYAGHT